MNSITLSELQVFPELLEKYFYSVSDDYRNWAPNSWEGIPSEEFTAIKHICHVRDIEIDGYHQRFKLMLEEKNPTLNSIDGYALAKERKYSEARPKKVFEDFSKARIKTLNLIKTLTKEQMNRTAYFDGYGKLSVRGLIHYLCSHDQQHLAGLQWLLGQIESNISYRAL